MLICNNRRLCAASLSSSPDEDTLAVMSLPQAAVTLIGHSKDMRRQLPHLVFAVQIDCCAVIQASYLLIGIYCCQDRTDVGLKEILKKNINILPSTLNFHERSANTFT